MRRTADLDGPDFYPTPRWATFALIVSERFEGEIWECACGDGAMSEVLKETGCSVFSSDLYQLGYAALGDVVDFLHTPVVADNIVTNPPYNCAEGFVAKGVKHARKKLALLLRLAFLEGANRANTIFARTPRPVFGYSANALPSTPRVSIQKVAAQRHTLGSSGTKTRPESPN